MDFSSYVTNYPSLQNSTLGNNFYSFVKNFTEEVTNSRDVSSIITPLGISVSSDFERNLLFGSLTALEVMKRKYLGQRTRFIDLGSGAGINCLVAKLFGAEKVTGIELDDKTYSFARKLMDRYKTNYDLIQDNFLTRDFGEEKFDIVLNENLYCLLTEEPQLQIAKRIKPNTNPDTTFIPHGIEFVLTYNQNRYVFEKILFDGNYEEKLVREAKINAEEKDIFVNIRARLFSEEKEVLGEKSNLQYLPLGSAGVLLLRYKTPQKRLTMSWDTSRIQSFREIFPEAEVICG